MLGEFLGRTSTFDEQRGLNGTWYKSRGYSNKQKAFDRVEGPVDFDWGTGAPKGEGFKAEEFSARWRGSIFTTETGTYEFIVKTENGIKLWVNSEQPILDAWVSDGQLKEHRISLRLLGGRAVPIALDFFKWKDKRASIELRWKPPHGVEEIIPRSQFMPKQSARVFTVQTPLPPDDSSHGFARGISVSKAWDEATTRGALDTAARMVRHMDRLAGTREDDPKRRDKVRAFAARFVAAAFRRPLTEAQRKVFVDTFFANDRPPADALKRTVILALKSPRFLYPDLHSPEPDAHQIAARRVLVGVVRVFDDLFAGRGYAG
ncbi:MAG: PA14 domain-containing protein [Burkholderiaceae bacterium]|nr:PA14 domain-containing protein [Burkholderiaceae bacterium]